MVAPDGQSVTLDIHSPTELEGTDPTCDLSIHVVSLQLNIFEIMPNMGESPGDPIRFCVQYVREQSAEFEGGYEGRSIVGGFSGGPSIQKPLSITRLVNNRVLPGFFDGPTTVSSGEQVVERECQFGAQIGDLLQLSAGVDELAMGKGIGAASVNTDVDLLMTVGGCDEAPLCSLATTPAVSSLNLGAIAVLLGALGGTLIRIRVRRHA
jgi:hypothetical protein